MDGKYSWRVFSQSLTENTNDPNTKKHECSEMLNFSWSAKQNAGILDQLKESYRLEAMGNQTKEMNLRGKLPRCEKKGALNQTLAKIGIVRST